MMKKLLLLVALCLLVALTATFTVTADAGREENGNVIEVEVRKYASAPRSETLSEYVGDMEKFTAYLKDCLMNGKATINLKFYPDGSPICKDGKALPGSEDNNMIYEIIGLCNGIVEAFNLRNNFFGESFGDELTSLIVDYRYSQEEYEAKLAECEAAADKLLSGIRGNDSLSDVEIALLLHDRLVLWNEYDNRLYSPEYNNNTSLFSQAQPESFTMYGALVNHISVCQGYARAYSFLLDKMGIENYLVTSDALNHEWNIVYIDGKPYHVDVTWDDGAINDWNAAGRVAHNNFLLSTAQLRVGANGSVPHNAFDYDPSPNDTAYDSYFWQKVDSMFVLVGSNVYYLENSTGVIRAFDDHSGVFTIGDGTTESGQTTWSAVGGRFYPGNHSKIATDGTEIFFNTANAIWSVAPGNAKAVKISDTVNDASAGHCVYGLSYDGSKFIYDVSTTPVFGGEDVRYTLDYVKITGISVQSNGGTEFEYGEDIRLDEIVLEVRYSDGTAERVSEGLTANLDDALPGTHTVTVSYQGFSTSYTVTITKRSVTSVPEFSAESVTDTSVTLTLVENAEYSSDGENWQDSNVFEDLVPGKKYFFYARYKENATDFAGNAGDGLEITTERTEVLFTAEIKGGSKAGDTLKVDFTGLPEGVLPIVTWYVGNSEIQSETLDLTEEYAGYYVYAAATLDTESYIGGAETNKVWIISSQVVWGDANNDLTVTALDIVRLKKYLASGTDTVRIGSGADANGDGTVDALDVVRLKRYFAEYDYLTGECQVRLGPDPDEGTSENPPSENEGWSKDIR